MAVGKHWEWRGFSRANVLFAAHFAGLTYTLLPYEIEDLYIWAPGLDVNVKVRGGTVAGLKFKRFQESDPPLELWLENPEEFFAFPLGPYAWNVLTRALSTAGITLDPFPGEAQERTATIAAIEKAGCILMRVKKQREVWIWQGPNGRVLVEQTRILHPQPLLSIALESEDIGQRSRLSSTQAKADLLAAIPALNLDKESPQIMNYMVALTIWASGNAI